MRTEELERLLKGVRVSVPEERLLRRYRHQTVPALSRVRQASFRRPLPSRGRWRLSVAAAAICVSIAGFLSFSWPKEDQASSPQRAVHLQQMQAHVVEPGETIHSIAILYYGDPSYAALLYHANPDIDPSRLAVGQQLLIPVRGER